MGCFLEFLYTGDYFPKKVPGQRTLEKDPSIPDVDLTGDQLLKHAKVYTLAEKFGLVHLKNLASSKIHCVNSTAKGEIAYARYVYEFTARDDTAIRVPVANFWATRSHTLRAEAEEEFRGLCLEFPQFGYDVLSKCSPCLFDRACSCSGSADRPASLQPASSTRSSSASATKRCTPAPPRAAPASGPDTAAPLCKSRKADKSEGYASPVWGSGSRPSLGRWRLEDPAGSGIASSERVETSAFLCRRRRLQGGRKNLTCTLPSFGSILLSFRCLLLVLGIGCFMALLAEGSLAWVAGTLEGDTDVSLHGFGRHIRKAQAKQKLWDEVTTEGILSQVSRSSYLAAIRGWDVSRP